MLESHASKSNGIREGIELDTTASDFKTSTTSVTILPPPSTHTPRPSSSSLASNPAFIIPIWIALSSGVITYNDWIYNKAQSKFPYPVFLVTWHLFFASIGTRALKRTTRLLDGTEHIAMTRDIFIHKIVPIGFLFSASLVLSNTAYLHLTVAFIQMLKAFTPVAILLISFSWRIQDPSKRLAVIVMTISGGVCLASYGEVHFDMFGFIVQALAVVFEASRLVMIQILLQGVKMDPLVSLHYYAPVCALINLLILPFTEGLKPIYALMDSSLNPGALVFFSNASIAFLLNIAAVFLVGAGGGLVLTLAGVFKDILLIASSVIIFGAIVTPVQVFGYSVALVGLIVFKTTGSK